MSNQIMIMRNFIKPSQNCDSPITSDSNQFGVWGVPALGPLIFIITL